MSNTQKKSQVELASENQALLEEIRKETKSVKTLTPEEREIKLNEALKSYKELRSQGLLSSPQAKKIRRVLRSLGLSISGKSKIAQNARVAFEQK